MTFFPQFVQFSTDALVSTNVLVRSFFQQSVGNWRSQRRYSTLKDSAQFAMGETLTPWCCAASTVEMRLKKK